MRRPQVRQIALAAAVAAVVFLCCLSVEWQAREAAVQAQEMGRAPTGNPQSTTWQHVRKDEAELRDLGNGSVDAGMNVLGDLGYELFIVTSVMDSGQAGYHFFKRPPWGRPLGRPQFEYKRIDTEGIKKMGNGAYGDGLIKIEKDGWEMIAVTTNSKGAVGFHYFKRPKR